MPISGPADLARARPGRCASGYDAFLHLRIDAGGRPALTLLAKFGALEGTHTVKLGRHSGAGALFAALALELCRFAEKTIVIGLVAFEQNDAAVWRDRIKDDSEACSFVMRVGPADAGPDRTLAAGAAFDGVGDEHGIVGHVLEA